MATIKVLWGKVSGAFWALVPFMGVAWGYFLAGVERIRTSIMALVNAPSVWLACGVVAFAGYTVGLGVGSSGKPELREKIVGLERAAAGQQSRIVSLQDGNRAALAEITKLKGKIEALEAEARRRETSSLVASPSRRSLPKARKPVVAAAPEKPAWWPFR